MRSPLPNNTIFIESWLSNDKIVFFLKIYSSL